MSSGIGEGKTRGDHREVADQLYTLYAQGRDLRRLVAIIGEAGLTETDRQILTFADAFERQFVNQTGGRTIAETLDAAWQLFADLPDRELKRIGEATLAARRPQP